jgi:hypothetical protein
VSGKHIKFAPLRIDAMMKFAGWSHYVGKKASGAAML